MIDVGSIQKFLRKHYSDTNLEHLLVAAGHGRVPWVDPDRCLTGRAITPHTSFLEALWFVVHPAAFAYGKLGEYDWDRCHKLLPLVKDEIERRAAIKLQQQIDSIPVVHGSLVGTTLNAGRDPDERLPRIERSQTIKSFVNSSTLRLNH